ncbi:MAG: GGDEF domain-containing protein [Acidobacteria bacterium]|nr:GGDEF domain-containing protein [Acidobacteriota bacterium]MCI0660491.1 GGDEF domain-containing protein [Acidobacteriota bacterium]
MSVLTDQNFLRVMLEQREWLQALDHRLRSHASWDDLDLLFREFKLLRKSIAERVKLYSDQLIDEQLIELHSQLNAELDNYLTAVIRSFIEHRVQSVAEQAQRDPLTMLPNRAAFDRRLRDEVERARRYHRELSVAFFDIDRFKSVNDQFGHPAGDRVLLQVANILQSSLRQSDAPFRYGGDEFAAVCPETSGDAMQSLVYRIEMSFRERCDAAQFDGHIGISWGVASLPVDAIEADELICVADRRLYVCKKEHHRLLIEKS